MRYSTKFGSKSKKYLGSIFFLWSLFLDLSFQFFLYQYLKKSFKFYVLLIKVWWQGLWINSHLLLFIKFSKRIENYEFNILELKC